MSYMTMRAKLDRLGYILSKRGDLYLITDLRGAPVHETQFSTHTQTADDVKWWITELAS